MLHLPTPLALAATTRLRILRPAETPRAMPSAQERAAAFEQLALPLFPALFNHASWLTRNSAEAEDLVQETFTKALRAFDSFEPNTNFKAWLFRILRNAFLNTRAGIVATRTVYLEDTPAALDTADTNPTPEATLLRLSNLAALQSALEQLPAPLREALLLCDLEELAYKEIATILDIPIGTVMSRISRARRTLREILEPQLGRSL
jgi:RNA polymerase sigma-70 factor, ECF subfamily